MLAEVLNENLYSAYRDRLSELLDIPVDASDSEIHQIIDAGFTTVRFEAFCEHGKIPPHQRDQIIPLRTLGSDLTMGQKLTVDESDRLFRNAYILAMAEAVFGDDEKARSWLSKPKNRFSGKNPITMLSTTPGARQVEELLIQVAEGIAL
ncbi:antitoxin Xre/MbcA/ParS toxin-binding domain-containing protein [Pseudomonas putida]|uniref:antitoxin Xre/MbcA/ParS toxin-binding domain-containing protein n=1 Tax=Pseudomonas putida TaxID=303 RepID=UPI00062B00F8|nr:antitoxin Xre/MbcA/ParS toxin-binding domain-containing protein [Pseudomonas putida]KKX68451.1 antitoxin [Pseudomonas putida]